MQRTGIKIAIVRSIGHEIDPCSYNCQEFGLAKALTAYGVSSTLFMAGCGKIVQERVMHTCSQAEVTVVQVPYVKMRGWQCYMPGLTSLLRKRQFDLIQVHEHNLLMSLLALYYAYRHRIPTVLCQGMYRDYQALMPRILQKSYELACGWLLRKFTSMCIAKTDAAALYLRSKKFTDIRVCPVGLDIAQLSAEEETNWRERFDIPATARVLLYVGGLEPRRNPEFLIRVTKALIDAGENVYLIMVGTGPDTTKCRQFIADANLTRRVILAGMVPQKQLPAFYRMADAFLLASDYEIYGMVLLEAMFFGVPVVSNVSAGSSQIVVDGETGYIIPELDVLSWRDRVRRLLNDKEQHTAFSIASKRRIEKKFLWSQAAQRFYEVYCKTLRDRGK